MTVNKTTMPIPVLQRLPRYLTHVFELLDCKVAWVSSRELAEVLNLTSSTVRQDLSYLDLQGIGKKGYETGQLEAVLKKALRADVEHRMVIIGAGNLGCALALHENTFAHGFVSCGILDADPKVVGKKVGKFTVQGMNQLAELVKKKKVDIGVVAVPAQSAQQVADELMTVGVKGLLNLAYTHIQTPKEVIVMDVRLLASLQELAFLIADNG